MFCHGNFTGLVDHITRVVGPRLTSQALVNELDAIKQVVQPRITLQALVDSLVMCRTSRSAGYNIVAQLDIPLRRCKAKSSQSLALLLPALAKRVSCTKRPQSAPAQL